MTKTERFLTVSVAMMAMAGLCVGYNGDGGLHKVLLAFSGMVTGFLIDYIVTGD